MNAASWLTCRFRVALAGIASALPLQASDWYVDAVHGDDANSGATAALAWRTLTHALASLPAPTSQAQTVNVAPGVYGPALGELFPLSPAAGVWIRGTVGSAATILEGAASSLFVFSEATSGTPSPSGAEGLTLRNSDRGIIVIGSTSGTTAPAFRDVVIEGMQTDGVLVGASASFFDYAAAHPAFERVTIAHCGVGVRISAGTTSQLEGATSKVELLDCSVLFSGLDGLSLLSNGNAMTHAGLTRCRVLANGRDGVHCTPSARTESVTARACLFADNLRAGLWGEANPSNFWLYDSTIAHNAAAGIHTANGHATDVHNSIVAANGDDVELSGPLYASFSNSADGELLGQPNCIAVDPLFVDIGAGDYRLRWGSPCIESGAPASASHADLLGHMRGYDGDLDTHGSVDMGAFEFEPLHVDGVARSGGSLAFELWGASGAHSRLLLSRQAVTAPQSTPFGSFVLLRPRTLGLLSVPLGPPTPARFTLRVPSSPALIGTTLTLQALTLSVSAPRGRALSNPVALVVEP
ncbi:MAG: right-handed parallel beta-helix repeat-containing protein [Planctomycetes bacterium]|nr:right-handed parallel beta-helix repeat-containing protein [Planctomycetota bacterium]